MYDYLVYIPDFEYISIVFCLTNYKKFDLLA